MNLVPLVNKCLAGTAVGICKPVVDVSQASKQFNKSVGVMLGYLRNFLRAWVHVAVIVNAEHGSSDGLQQCRWVGHRTSIQLAGAIASLHFSMVFTRGDARRDRRKVLLFKSPLRRTAR